MKIPFGKRAAVGRAHVCHSGDRGGKQRQRPRQHEQPPGKDVTFDLGFARFVVADTNKDGAHNLAGLADGDHVLVKARLPRKDPGTQPFKARMVIDNSARPKHSH